MKQKSQWINKFYTFQAESLIGIFTSEKAIRRHTDGRPGTINDFDNYFKAVQYLKSSMSEKTQIGFGILHSDLVFNLPYYWLEPVSWEK